MTRKNLFVVFAVAAAASLLFLSACGGGGGGMTPPALSVSCSPAQVQVLNTSQCSVSPAVTGSWSVAPGAGSISPSGLYTAPATPGSETVRFTANDGTGRSGQFTIVVVLPPSPGDIVFTRITPGCGSGCIDIFVMNEDGSNVRQLTTDQLSDFAAVWRWNKGLIAFVSNRDTKIRIYTMNPDGTNQKVISSTEFVQATSPGFFPDGRIAFVWQTDTEAGIGVMQADGSGTTKLFSDSNWTNLPGPPKVSPDGAQILFSRRNSAGILQIWVMPADGSSPPTVLSPNPSQDADPAWHPAGNQIAFASNRGGGDFAIWTMSKEGGSHFQVTFPPPGFADIIPTWSPDGNKIAFVRTNGVVYDIYVVTAGSGTPQKLTSVGLNIIPDWR